MFFDSIISVFITQHFTNILRYKLRFSLFVYNYTNLSKLVFFKNIYTFKELRGKVKSQQKSTGKRQKAGPIAFSFREDVLRLGLAWFLLSDVSETL